MLIVFKTIHQILKLLNSETAPSQLASGVAFGFLIGLTPFFGLHNLCFFLVVFLFRINLSFFFLSWGFGSAISFFLDPLFDRFGYWALVDFRTARPFWIEITSGSIWPFFRFNNTVMIGSLMVGLLIFFPLFFLTMKLVSLYRQKWRDQLRESRWVKALKVTPLWGLYEKYVSFRSKMSALS